MVAFFHNNVPVREVILVKLTLSAVGQKFQLAIPFYLGTISDLKDPQDLKENAKPQD